MTATRWMGIKRLRAAVLGAALAFFALPAAVASSDLSGPNVVHYPSDMEFVSSSERIIRGTATTAPAPGCEFPITQTSLPDDRPVGVEEIAFNPDTCEALVLEGEIAQSEITEEQIGDPTATGLDMNSLLEPLPSGDLITVQEMAWRRAILHHSSAWEDPAQLDVNKVENWINWKPGQSCAAANWSEFGYRQSWRDGTGWRRSYHNWDRGANCDRVLSSSVATFENKPFCNPSTFTYTWYSPNRVRGYAAGRYAWDHWAGKGGDCAGLLHFEGKTWIDYPG